MICSSACLRLNDRQRKALENYAERKGLSKPTTTGTMSMVIAELPEYKELEPKPGNNGDDK